MRSRWAAILVAAMLPAASAIEWQRALPGYVYQFPRDHFSHPNYRTEWWYYTGNLRATDGHRFGFELTFFREAVDLPPKMERSESVWRPDQVYVAHLALSDIDGGEFYHTDRINRAGPGLAGAGFDQQRYWNGNWQSRWMSTVTGEQKLEAVCSRFTLNLDLKPLKPLVIHGQNGVSVKGPVPGEASHYLSFTRLAAAGELQWNGASFSLTGLAWMDHEFFTEQLDKSLAGWDWFSIQLDNGEELMLYRLRRKDGAPDPYSSGTFVDARGQAHFLAASEFSVVADRLLAEPRFARALSNRVEHLYSVVSAGTNGANRVEGSGAVQPGQCHAELLGRRRHVSGPVGLTAGPWRRLPRNDRV